MPKNKNLRELSRQSLRRRLQHKNKVSPSYTKNLDQSTKSGKIDCENGNIMQMDNLVDENADNLNEDRIYSESSGLQEPPSEIDEDDDTKDIHEYGNPDVAEFLISWALKYNIKANAINDLLTFLKHSLGLNVPIDSRTLLKTPQSRVEQDSQPGKYVHIGLRPNLDNLLLKYEEIPHVELDINIDGVPISRSNRSCFWPILGRVFNLDQRSVFVIGIYHGYNKPDDFNKYLRPLVDELKDLLMNGYVNNGNNIRVKIRSFICDAPARSGILGTKSHTGYFGCLKCTEEGEFIKNRMVFPIENNCELRTNQSFRERKQLEHHKFDSILEELPVDMIRQFPLEYLHLVCLGVLKKIIHMWLNGDSKSLLANAEVQKISENLNSISLNEPSGF